MAVADVTAVDERVPQGFGSEKPTLLSELLLLQAELPKLPKDKTNPHFGSKFTGLDTIVERTGPLLVKHQMAWITKPGRDELGPYLGYRLVFLPTGEAETGEIPLLLAKDDMQGLGSALTYARRYALTCVLNLVSDEDDDGSAASTPANVQNLQGYAKGLSTDGIKSAYKQAGMSVPGGSIWQALTRVPDDKAQALYAAIQAVKLKEGER